jgi:hypothetical protein
MQEVKVLPEVLVKEIKQAFPNVISAQDRGGTHVRTYCVGGAFIQYMKGEDNFPNAFLLARKLCKHISGRTTECTVHMTRASAITRNNDSRNFDAAWNELQKALETPCSLY